MAEVPRTSLVDVLARLTPIRLEQMQGVALLRRVDTKLVLPEAQLVRFLAQVDGAYRVLEIDGRRIHHYRTLYFDTPDYALYHQHHNGQRVRYKVRTRVYEDSGLAFLEVKRKTNQDVTIKERVQVPGITPHIGACGAASTGPSLPYPADSLAPALWNHFRRVTLVSKQHAERLTLDVDLSFRAGQNAFALPGVAVIEIKQPAGAARSEFADRLRTLGVRPVSFSKYCVGISMLVPQVKRNHFKPQHMLLERILQEGNRV